MAQDVAATWLGHATFLLHTPEGKTILVDPWLAGNPKCPKEFHQTRSDLILITHGHGDHTGDAVEAASRCSGRVVAIVELAAHLSGLGIDESKLVAMNKGGTVALEEAGIRVTMTDARHTSSAPDAQGRMVYTGEPAGYVVRFSSGTTLYIAGDTCLFGDMDWIRTLYAPDVAILPIGDFYTMDPRAASHACQLLGVKEVIPCHYGTFPALCGTPEQLRAEVQQRGLAVKITELPVGRRTKIG
jgi:L-ascorbate metabolism protein UlaG (beta-lactamase superfamily)